MDRHSSHSSPVVGDPDVFIKGAQANQKFTCDFDLRARRWVDPIVRIESFSRECKLKKQLRQFRSQNLGWSIFRAAKEISFAVQAKRDARPRSTGASGSLNGRRAADLFELQPGKSAPG